MEQASILQLWLRVPKRANRRRSHIRNATAIWIALALIGSSAFAQTDSPDPERWNLFYQATSIGQYHGTFPALYDGPLSLRSYPEKDASLTTTLFFGLRLARNTQFYFDGEIAGGKGFSNVNGLANPTNGELPRVASATPKPYIARLYISQDFGFGDQTEKIESDANQLAGERPMTRYTIVIGRFTVTDFFDNNRYSHDPRTQFMGWAMMYNGAWDYPAGTRVATPGDGCTSSMRSHGRCGMPKRGGANRRQRLTF